MNAADLQSFCSEADDIRWFLCKPWSAGEYTYASNGHIIIRVARLPDVPEQPKAPDAAKMFAKIAPASNWMPVPPATRPAPVMCPECDGTGIIEGEGPDDDSEDCEWCNHTGEVTPRIGIQVGDVYFDQTYLSMLQGWEISPDGTKNAAWIRNGDVVGLLMPRTRP